MTRQPGSRSWTRPELIVVGRSDPQEQVLVTCKQGNIYTASNVDRWGGCYAEPYFPTPCANVCSELAAS